MPNGPVALAEQGVERLLAWPSLPFLLSGRKLGGTSSAASGRAEVRGRATGTQEDLLDLLRPSVTSC